MSEPDAGERPRVAIVGGGVAGLAAAAALAERGIAVELFEARRQLGGRAGSFFDAESGEWLDHCQHVVLGCCTNFFAFARRTGITGLLQREPVLHFFAADGKRFDMAASAWLPAPLHLLPALWRLKFLSRGERVRIMRTLLRMAKTPSADSPGGPTVGEWLRQQGESENAIGRFWSVVLVSALGESVERACLSAARKVFVDGFMAARSAYEMYVPTVPLGELYHERVGTWLREQGVSIQLETQVENVASSGSIVTLQVKGGAPREFSAAILAVPWRRIADLLSSELAVRLPELQRVEQIESSPISGVHLWFDRPITNLPHAVLVDRLSQWVFAKAFVGQTSQSDRQAGKPDLQTPVPSPQPPTPHYYQVVISASRDLAGRNREDVLREVCDDLRAVFPAAREAKLLRSRVVTDPFAVFSVRPGIDALRPPQQTSVENIFLAGDWTATGWPATMEGAVRSGHLAAEGVLNYFNCSARMLVPDLPRSRLARWILG